MKFQILAESQSYFEISNYMLCEDRLAVVREIFEILAALPFALVVKVWRTLLEGMGIVAAIFFLLLTVGISKGVRELFVSRVSSFAANLADWVLYPFALATCLSRLFLASLFTRC